MDPEQVAKWWGPRGFTITTHGKDLRPGGYWHYTMHGPDGVDYLNKTIYHEVEKHKKLVYDHGGYDDRPPLFRVTVLFSEHNGKTKLEMTMVLETAEKATEMRQFIKNAGGNATWDRLAEYLSETQSGQAAFVVNRCFTVPIDVMFDMWTDPDHFSKWLPPVGFDMKIRRANILEEGDCFFQMTNHQDTTFYGKLEYREVCRPSRLQYVQRFCDESENVSRHPGLPEFPEALLTTVEFVAEDDQTTRITVTMEPAGTATTEEMNAFLNARAGMTQGWAGSFDKLDSVLSVHQPSYSASF